MTLLTLVAAGSTQAQPTLAPWIQSGQGPLTAQARQQVEDYLAYWADQLHQGQGGSVGLARRKLTEPLLGDSSPSFKATYSTACSRHLTKALQSAHVLVRINAMMVAQHLVESNAVALIKKGLADASPGGRFAAGRAALNLVRSNQPLSKQDERAVISCIGTACSQETCWPVQVELIRVLGTFSSIEAAGALLGQMDRLVVRRAAQPAMPIGAELDGLTRLFRSFLLNRGSMPEPTKRMMVVVAYRYMRLSAGSLQVDLNSEPLREDYASMVGLCDHILHELVDLPQDQIPPSTEQAVDAGRWDHVLAVCAGWETVLVRRTGFKPELLRVPDVTRPAGTVQ